MSTPAQQDTARHHTAQHRTALRATVRDRAHAWRERLVELSHRLHADPETAFEEHRSAEAVAALAEYDALPGLGHACGHNVNGTAALGAAIALGAVADELGITVKLIGTPAEEDAGGKVLLIEAGVFDDVAAAMMVHAAPSDSVGGSSLAISGWDVVYTGRAAHAAAAPWEGVNALDALTVAQTAIGLLRQQLPGSTVVSGIITDGGSAANVIPDRAAAHFEMRAPTLERLRAVQARVRACFEAGALATGASVTIEPRGNEFADLRQDPAMSEIYASAVTALGRTLDEEPGLGGSTDMGNVSHVVPAIHPMIGYDTGGAHQHTVEFAAAGTTPAADLAILDGAVAMAWTAVELATDPQQRRRLLARSRPAAT
ncbi:amidohydrolase [Streptomyces sp. NBC_01104]|uniref:amidohydrolase n=1 Tax=Streptomyces sp. NBC_01104 TaxID=2903750 RepID=UPI003870AF90|nr:amidohydrolase [Streptomyces sp. NBC_01104]